MILTNNQIDKAVTWWMNNIQHPSHRQVKPEQETEQTILGAGMSAMLVEEIPNKKIMDFGMALRGQLKDYNPHYIRVDYHPDKILSKAAEMAELPEHNWSIKTSMEFSGGAVSVSEGYGSPYIIL